jgi:hypothetical protein
VKNGIIAFCGCKGSGKSTASNMVKELYHGPIEELAFADKIKQACSVAFNVPIEYFYDQRLKEGDLPQYINLTAANLDLVLKQFDLPTQDFTRFIRPHVGVVLETPRRLMQYIGTEVLQMVNRHIHAAATLKQKDPSKLTIISDLRFAHEFDAVVNSGYPYLVAIVHNIQAEHFAQSDMHLSEKELVKFKDQCLFLPNNQGLVELRRNVQKLILEPYDFTSDRPISKE